VVIYDENARGGDREAARREAGEGLKAFLRMYGLK
jgi:hypothetical protein